MLKKALLPILVLIGSFSLYAEDEEIIPWRKDITMLVVPREPLAVQVAQDISRRYPVLLVCYQATPAEPALHAWNGKGWVPVATADYVNGTFFTHRPRHAVIVETKECPAPEILIPDGTWCANGNRLTSTDTRVMIHLLGRYFDFPYRYWMQFSQRYNYALEEINPALINVPWVHYRGDKVIPAFKARDRKADMDKWFFLDITPPEPIEPVVIEAEPEALPQAEIPAEELIEEPADEPVELPAEEPAATVEEIVVELTETVPEVVIEDIPAATVEINPFSTNDIPAAELILPPAE